MATLAYWQFNEPGAAPTTMHSGVSVTNMSDSGVALMQYNTNVSPVYATAPVFRAGTSRTYGSMNRSTAYIEFTISTADPASTIKFTQLSFLGARGGTPTTRGMYIGSDENSYATDLATVIFTTQRPNWNTYTVDLTSLAETNTRTFRFFPFAPSSGSTVEIDNLTLTGEILSPPGLRTWNGASWVAVKHWNGTAWV